MHAITVGFSRPKNHPFPILSWIIRIVEKTPYSHVYVRYWDDELQQEVMLEAQGAATKAVNWENRSRSLEEVQSYTLYVSYDEYLRIKREGMHLTGIVYGYGQLIGIGLVKLCYAFGKRIINPFASRRNSMVCSELVGYILRDILGIKISERLDQLTPRQIEMRLERL